MNKFMKRLAKNEGFTLIELIVVIAIVAILAGVATAGYASYIKKANNSAVQSELENLSTAAVIANAISGDITGIKVAVDTADIDGDSNTTELSVVFNADAFATTFQGDFEASYNAPLTKVEATDTTPEYYYTTIAAFSSWSSSDYKDLTDGVDYTNGAWEKPAA